MKRFVLAGVAVLAVAATVGSASAADLGRRQAMPTKAPEYVVPYNWTGFYVGINGGAGFGRSAWSNGLGSTSFNTSGGLVGGTLGYNWQMPNSVVVGLEGDIDWTNLRGSATGGACGATGCDTRNDWLGTARGRIGYAFNRFMPYVTGGAAFGDIKSQPAGLTGQSTTRAGWAVGGGGELAIAGPWTAKLEYLYVDLGSANCGVGNCAPAAAGSTSVDFRSSLVRGGLNYRF
jgi:outer membrane immunogenic protein